MEQHIVKVLETEFVTHNVKRFQVEKPAGYTYVPGQATDVSINKPGLENELRPFTFTSRTKEDYLEFIIKIYKGHNGVTEKLQDIGSGDELILHEVFGTIRYVGPGLFIAGGAGITPFIAILRQLKEENKLAGNRLLFANRTAADIILRQELSEMLGDNFFNVLEQPDNAQAIKGFIDSNLLQQHITATNQYFYICGPDRFTAAMIGNLLGLGVEDNHIIREQ
jgi:ferredoxin-NADP reductase